MTNKQLTNVSPPEVLPALTREGVDEIEKDAIRLYAQSQRTSLQFAMEIRRLQDGAAHIMRGYPNFGKYIEDTFEGLSAINAQQISRTGNVLRILENAGRIDAYKKPDDMPGVTGVRALATILGQFGDDAMISVYDKAASTGRKVLETNVKAALMEVVEIPKAELGEGSTEPDDKQVEEDDDDGYTEETSESLDRIDWIRGVLDDLVDSIMERKQDRTETCHKALEHEVGLLGNELRKEYDSEWLEKGR